jgi:protocatechuate 3,4-dioxygenase beta subunit
MDKDHTDGEVHDHDLGLQHDLKTLSGRRQTLKLLAGAGAMGLAGFVGYKVAAGDSGSSNASTSAGSGGGSGAPAGGASMAGSSPDDGGIPEETNGPYPADGTNGVNVLTESGIVRRDIRSSFGSASDVAEGIPLTIRYTVTDADSGDPLSGAAVYLWHCDREGRYSMYSEGITEENYLRGVQEVASDGTVEFTSIFPACYSGRWPHLHFEIYPSLDEATAAGTRYVTSQLAFPEDPCNAVYATDGYEQSVSNMSSLSLETDGIFSDGYDLELGTVTGSTSDGYTVTLDVPVATDR